MKRLIFQLALPLTVIVMFAYTKWSLVLPIDGTQTKMWGFPFSFAAEGWHTSLSYQIFITEFLADFLIQLLFWALFFFLINKYLITIKHPKILIISLRTLAIIISAAAIFVAAMPEQLIQLKRGWEIGTFLDSGYKFFWDDVPDIKLLNNKQNTILQ